MADKSALLSVIRLFLGLAGLVAMSFGVDWLLRAENVPVASVRFEGPFRHVTQSELEAAAVEPLRGNFFLVNLETVRERVESIPWVYRASVRRSLPNDVTVRFTEQQLVAHWGEKDWVNAAGEVAHVRMDDAPELPWFDGPGGTSAQVLAAYNEFSPTLAAQGLRLLGLELSARRTWRLDVERVGALGTPAQRFALVLDHDQPRARLERFARVYASTLAQEVTTLRQVDLRYTNGFAVERQATRLGSATQVPARAQSAAMQGNKG